MTEPGCYALEMGMYRLTCAAADILAGVKGGMKNGIPAIGGRFKTMNLRTEQRIGA